MQKTNYILIPILLLLTKLVNAQSNQKLSDTLVLVGSLKEASRQSKAESLSISKQLPFDWATQPLSEISYKSYGPSGVGSLSYRGLPASQTPLIWNGINLSSLFVGQADVNQIPLSSQWGAQLAGADAGTVVGSAPASRVSVQPIPLIADSASSGIAILSKCVVGTYTQHQSETALHLKVGQWQTYARYFFQEAQNDFKIYRHPGLDPTLPIYQTNASLFNRQAEGSLSYQSHQRRYSSTLAYLFNQSQRDLPPPTTKFTSQERLYAKTHAVSLRQQWRMSPSFSYNSVAGFVGEQSLYLNEGGIPNPYGTSSFQLAGSLSYDPRSERANKLSAIVLTHSHAYSQPTRGDYVKSQLLSHTLSVDAIVVAGRWQATPGIALGYFKERTYPLPGLKLARSFTTSGIGFTTSFLTKGLFRPPTLNDLYYPTLGNPDLHPEQGRLYEIQLSVESNNPSKRIQCQFALTPFVYQYQTFISWIPRGNVWSPRQRTDARSSGITALALGSIKIGKWKLTTRQQITWLQGGYGGPFISLEARPEPFIYTPSLRSTSSITLSRRNLTLELRTTFTGTDSLAGQPPLPSYFLHTARAEWEIPIRKEHLFAFAATASWANPPGYAFIANYAAPHWWGNLAISYRFSHVR